MQRCLTALCCPYISSCLPTHTPLKNCPVLSHPTQEFHTALWVASTRAELGMYYPTPAANPRSSLTHTLLQEGHTALWVAGTRAKLDVLKALLAAGAKKEAKAEVRMGVAKLALQSTRGGPAFAMVA